MHISDEQLMAFADGELTGEEARSVEDVIMADPELAARVETFRRTRALVAGASRARPMASERDAALIAKIRAAAGGPPEGAAPSPHAGGQATWKILRPANSNWMPTAVAAGLALALVIGWWSGLFGGGSRDGGLEQALVAALESVPSGETAPVNGSEFTAIASYHTEGGELCREYEVHGTATATVAVACHGPEGWQNRFTGALSETGDTYALASGDMEELDAFLADTGVGAPLTPEDEAAALAGLKQAMDG